VDNTAPGGEPARAEGTGSGDGRKLILLVEDNDADRDIYGGLLWYNGYDVIHAATGEEAVAKALDARPDLVLLDIRLAGELSGLDVARHLRAEGLDVPIIVLSAVPRDELGTATAEVGIRTYLEKPIDPFSVVRVVMKGVGTAQGDR
jgi:adenylate cyclase